MARCNGLLHVLLMLCAGTAVAQTGDVGDWSARGIIRALHRPVLSSEITARVAKLPVRAGESFREGDVLVTFDCDRLVAERAKARARVAAARAKRDSDRQLAELKSIGALEVALSEAKVAEAVAELRVANLEVAGCRIRAPYDGRVVQLMVDEHQSVREQQELIEIVDSVRLEIEFVVPGGWTVWLEPGQPIELTVDETGETVRAAVHATAAAIDPVSHSASVRAKVTESAPDLLPGMSGTVQVVR